MTIRIVRAGKTRKFYLPLSRLLLRLVLQGAVPVKKEKAAGQVCGDIPAAAETPPKGKKEHGKKCYTREEKASLIATAEEMRKALKAFRRAYGGFTLVEVRDGADGEEIFIRV